MKNQTLRCMARLCRAAFSFLAILFFLAQAPLFGRGVREPDYSPSSEIPRDPKVITGELESGIRYYIRRNVRPENRAELRLAVNAGSLLEDDDQRGLAHLVEHMAFQGTRNFARHELVGWLESIGMRFGPETNAYTSFDETVYQLTVPTDDSSHIDTGLSILNDWMEGLTIDSDALKKERGVVLEEWRLGRGVNSRVRDVQIPVLLSGSRYAERLPIGKPEVITDSPEDRVRSFYRDWYRPDLSAIIAVGDFDPNEMERRIRERFSRPADAPGRQRKQYPVPAHGETLVSCVSDPELGQTSVGIYAKREAKTLRTIAEYRERIAESLFFSIMNERLDEVAKRPDAPFLAAGMGTSRLARPVRAAYLAANVEETGPAEGLAALVREVKRAVLHGFSQAELERAKAVYLRSFEQTWREAENLSSSALVSLYVNNYLEARPMLGPEYSYGLAQRYVPGIKEDEVAALARNFLEEENRVVLVTAPTSGRLLSEEEVREVLRSAAAEDPEALVEEAAPGALLENLPPPGEARRVQSSQAEAAGFTEWKLENGMRVVLKTTDFKNDELLVTAFSPGGTSRAADDDYLCADFAENLAQESGAGAFSLVQLQKFLSGKKVTLMPRIYGQTQGFQGSSSVKDAQTLFQLIAAYFTEPRLDTDATSAYLRQVKSSLREEEKQPDTIFVNKVREVLTQNHLRSRPVTPDMIDTIDIDKAFAFYRDRFADASNFTFIFVGSVSAQDLEPYLEKYLAGLPSSYRGESHADTGLRLFRGKKEETVHAGREERSLVALLFTGDFVWSREEAFALRILEDYLDLRLREVLREDKGGTYGVSVQADAYRYPAEEYSIGIYFGASPQTAMELSQTALAAIQEMKTTLPSEADTAKVREQALRTHERLLRENSFWLERLRFELYHKLAADIDAWRSREIKAISPRRIQELLRKYCNPENLARVILMPAEE